MSGTSIDGIDAALVRIDGTGLSMRAHFIRGCSVALVDLAPALRAVAEQRPHTAGELARIALDFAQLHVSALTELIISDRIDLIAIHGQTVFHKPPISWQLFNAAPVAAHFTVPVVSDLRAMDIARGGQGAPITPLADWVFFRDREHERVVINLGGFCNLTHLPKDCQPEAISGEDVCACNQLLDAVARQTLGCDFDQDGAHAAAGAIDDAAFNELSLLLTSQAGSGRSLGTGDELAGAVKRLHGRMHGPDIARTACAAVAQTIADRTHTAVAIAAGGGVRNRTLFSELASRLNGSLLTSDDLGLPATYREAAEMAVLGALSQDRVPITLPRVTGVQHAPLSGSWTLP
jgi:anhydro-N-acetylmuramic acid kinase